MSALFSKILSIGMPEFATGSENKKSLSIELLPDGFSFCILDNSEFRYVVLESYKIDHPAGSEQWLQVLREFWNESPWGKSHFDKISVSWFSSQLVLIPFALFDPTKKEIYFNSTNTLAEDHVVLYDRLNNLEAYGQYAIPQEVKNLVDDLFPSSRIRHSGTVLIESLLSSLSLNEWSASLVLNIGRKHFDILLFEQGKMLFFNSFRYEEFGDMMYYLFFVLEQFAIEASSIDALLMGEISLDSERYRNLSQYFRKVSFIGRSDIYRYCREFDALPHHYYYSLLNLNSCG
jgi:hypothetical protein